MFLNLPRDIILDILLRVPAKSLIQIKYVCKLWFNLISDRGFAHAHIKRHQDPHIIIDFLCPSPFVDDYYSVKSQDVKDMEVGAFKIYLQLQEWFKGGILLKASCDGLLLLQSKPNANQLYVCNPITQNCKKLPRLDIEYRVWEIWDWVLVRGGDSVDFKVVGISRDSCSVFKIGRRDSRWEEIDTPYEGDSRRLSEHSASLVNKEHHWLIRRYQGNGSKIHYETYIYSVNAAAEKFRFRETHVSPLITCKHNENSILEVKGRLCLTDAVSCSKYLVIWTLQDRDKQWIKNYSITLQSQLGSFTRVYNLPNGSNLRQTVIIIHHKNRVLAYDMESKYCRRIDTFPDKRNVFTRFRFVYMDSLINWD